MQFLAFFLLAWCANAFADPLSEFEAIVKRCKDAYDVRPAYEVDYIEKQKSWVKRAYSNAKITYDVRRTDSLVSPYSGHVEVLVVVAVKAASDEQDAKALEVSLDERPIRLIDRVNYLYQGGAWAVASGSSKMDIRRDGRYGNDTAFEKSREQMLKTTGPLQACIVEK